MPLHYKYLVALIAFLFNLEIETSASGVFKDSALSNTLSVAIRINAIAEDSVSCVIPFSRAGNLIVVQARADTIDGNFILDTGAPHLILNLTYFREYPATQQPDAEQNSVTGAGPAVVKTSVN